MGLKKIPWVSFRGWWDNRRYHGSLSGVDGAIEDTVGLFQWDSRAIEDTIIMGLFQGG